MRQFNLLRSKVNSFCEEQEKLVKLELELLDLKAEIESQKQLIGLMGKGVDNEIEKYEENKTFEKAKKIFTE